MKSEWNHQITGREESIAGCHRTPNETSSAMNGLHLNELLSMDVFLRVLDT